MMSGATPGGAAPAPAARGARCRYGASAASPLTRAASAPALHSLLTRKLSVDELLTPNGLFKSASSVCAPADLLPSSSVADASRAQLMPDRALQASRARAAKSLHRGQPPFSLLDQMAGTHLTLDATRPSTRSVPKIARPATAAAMAPAQELEPTEAASEAAVKLASRIFYEAMHMREPMHALVPTIARL